MKGPSVSVLGKLEALCHQQPRWKRFYDEAGFGEQRAVQLGVLSVEVS